MKIMSGLLVLVIASCLQLKAQNGWVDAEVLDREVALETQVGGYVLGRMLNVFTVYNPVTNEWESDRPNLSKIKNAGYMGLVGGVVHIQDDSTSYFYNLKTDSLDVWRNVNCKQKSGDSLYCSPYTVYVYESGVAYRTSYFPWIRRYSADTVSVDTVVLAPGQVVAESASLSMNDGAIMMPNGGKVIIIEFGKRKVDVQLPRSRLTYPSQLNLKSGKVLLVLGDSSIMVSLDNALTWKVVADFNPLLGLNANSKLICNEDASLIYYFNSTGLFSYNTATKEHKQLSTGSVSASGISIHGSTFMMWNGWQLEDLYTKEYYGKGLPKIGVVSLLGCTDGLLARSAGCVLVKPNAKEWTISRYSSPGTNTLRFNIVGRNLNSLSLVTTSSIGIGVTDTVYRLQELAVVPGTKRKLENAANGFVYLSDNRLISVVNKPFDVVTISREDLPTDTLIRVPNTRHVAMMEDSSLLVVAMDGFVFRSDHYSSTQFYNVELLEGYTTIDTLVQAGANAAIFLNMSSGFYYASTNYGRTWQKRSLPTYPNQRRIMSAMSASGRLYLCTQTYDSTASKPYSYIVTDISRDIPTRITEYSSSNSTLYYFAVDVFDNSIVLADRTEMKRYLLPATAVDDQHETESSKTDATVLGYYDILGRRLLTRDLSQLPSGMFIILYSNGTSETRYAP
ncbi:MAG: hypothetical protein HQ472_07080 [Ignavibacteria bacterium]|nr:hypothetical protein [Ignavibacteria bacterium]